MDISDWQMRRYYAQGYRFVGQNVHTACKICQWTKNSLIGKGVCYKERWYGVSSHRCLQCTPAMFFCNQRCVFCWRDHDSTKGIEMDCEVDEPAGLIDGLIEQQRLLLNGFKGDGRADMKKYKESRDPTNAAISLAGEPTLYPKLSEMIEEFRKREMTTFLVSNGTRPNVLGSITLPTQLYISLDAPNPEVHKSLNVPMESKTWERINETLELLPSLGTRKVIRVTLVKGHNMVQPEGYARLIEKAQPDFVEVKAYMHVGYSVYRLGAENMPSHEETCDFARQINEHLGYEYKDDIAQSRVALLARK